MDAVETAARAEAARRWHSTVTGRIRQIDFVAGAEWARDHLAAHSDLTVESEAVTVESDEPTDAEVEAAKAVLDAHEYAEDNTRYGKNRDGSTFRICKACEKRRAPAKVAADRERRHAARRQAV